jgi:hypothetical protein
LTEKWFVLFLAGYAVDRSCFRGVIAVFHIDVVGYIIDHYYLSYYRGLIHIVVAVTLLTITF